MKISIYVLVFGLIALIVIAAFLSTFVFSMSPSNVTLYGLQNLGPAPNLQGISAWINSQPLNLSQLRGKVVLIDFWTYSCINCIRTIPYLNAWQSKYGNNGLVIIGVSTPEFAFEHNYSNVFNAVQRFGIKYAVALDNNYSTWTAYNNKYWPADYLIDKNGSIREVGIGEGNYANTEKAIQLLLANAGYNISGVGLVSITTNYNLSLVQSPEIYMGYSTARAPIGNLQGFSQDKVVYYTISNITKPNVPYFLGAWYDAADSMISVNGSRLFLVYRAKNVNIVASGNSIITIKMDNKNLTQANLGADDKLVNGVATANITSSRLYNIASSQNYTAHLLEIDADPGFRIYTFTFG